MNPALSRAVLCAEALIPPSPHFWVGGSCEHRPLLQPGPWARLRSPCVFVTRGSSELTLPSCVAGHTNLFPVPKLKLFSALAWCYSRAASSLPEKSRCFPGCAAGRHRCGEGGRDEAEEMAPRAQPDVSPQKHGLGVSNYSIPELNKSMSRPFPAARIGKNWQDWKEESRPVCGG